MVFFFKTYFFRRSVMAVLMAIMVMPALDGCAKNDHNTVTVVKPKTKKRPYNPSKDKGKKRTKKVKVQN